MPSGQHVLGSPAIPVREQRRIFQMIARLPEMHRQLRELSGPDRAAHGRDGHRPWRTSGLTDLGDGRRGRDRLGGIGRSDRLLKETREDRLVPRSEP